MSIHPGNSKLGSLVWSWSLPAGQTCPGQSALCHKLCYGRRGRFCFPDVKVAHEQADQATRRPGFSAWLTTEILRRCVLALRIHAVGDFYSAAYVRKWITIVRHCRRTTFYAYTRSWRCPPVRAALRCLALEPNVHLWYSCDRETGRPPRDRRVRLAWMAEHDADLPRFGVDLVFRNTIEQARKKLGGHPVCVYDQGIARKIPVTCSHCQLCWKESYGSTGSHRASALRCLSGG